MANSVTIDAVDRVVSILTSELAGSQVAVGNSSVVPLPADGFIVVSEKQDAVGEPLIGIQFAQIMVRFWEQRVVTLGGDLPVPPE